MNREGRACTPGTGIAGTITGEAAGGRAGEEGEPWRAWDKAQSGQDLHTLLVSPSSVDQPHDLFGDPGTFYGKYMAGDGTQVEKQWTKARACPGVWKGLTLR